MGCMKTNLRCRVRDHTQAVLALEYVVMAFGSNVHDVYSWCQYMFAAKSRWRSSYAAGDTEAEAGTGEHLDVVDVYHKTMLMTFRTFTNTANNWQKQVEVFWKCSKDVQILQTQKQLEYIAGVH